MNDKELRLELLKASKNNPKNRKHSMTGKQMYMFLVVIILFNGLMAMFSDIPIYYIVVFVIISIIAFREVIIEVSLSEYWLSISVKIIGMSLLAIVFTMIMIAIFPNFIGIVNYTIPNIL